MSKKPIFALMRFLLLIFSIVFPSLLMAGKNIVNLPYSQRQMYFVWNFYDHPRHDDSLAFFSEVAKLQKLAQDHNDRELLLETKYMRLNFLSGRKYKNYIPEIKALMRTVDNERLLHFQIRTRQALAFHYLYEQKDYAQALYYFLQSYSFIQQISEVDFPEKQEALTNIANVCYRVGYFYKALFFIKEAQKYNYQYADYLHFNILNTKGLIFIELGKINDAEKIFRELLADAVSSKKVIWELMATMQLAEIHHQKGNYRTSLNLLDEYSLIKLADNYNFEPKSDSLTYRNLISSAVILTAENYLAQKDTVRFLKTMERIISQSSFNPLNKLALNFRIYSLKTIYHRQQNNLRKALLYADSALFVQKRLTNMQQETSIKNTIDQNNYKQLVKKDKALKRAQKQHKQQLILWFVVSLFVVTIGILFYVYKRKIHRVKISEQQKHIRRQQTEILSGKERLKQLIEEINRKNEIIRELPSETAENNEMLTNVTLLRNEDWEQFKAHFSTIYPHFLPVLKQIKNRVTPANERLMTLMFLGMDNGQIAKVLAISKDSVSRSKRRLKAEFDIPAEIDFRTWFETKKMELSEVKFTPFAH